MKTQSTENVHINTSPIHGLWALTNRELKKWYKAPVILLMSMVQPIIWLALFGKSMNFGALFTGNAFNIPGLNIPKDVLNSISQQLMQSTFGTHDYFSFLAVGMLSFVALFTAMYSGMSIVWDRRLGFLNKLLSTPLARGVIPMAKVLSSVIRGLTQSAVVFVIAILLGLDLTHITVLGVIGTFVALFLMLLGLSSLFVMLAIRSTSWESQMAIMNLLNLPLLFASNALFPAKFMPGWLQPIVRINPISYATDVSRQLLLGAPGMATLTFDFMYLGAFAACLSLLGMYMSWKFLTK
ncbi:MAG TPA: ABC transporter permease [Candidatus Saccharimonadales bacterium]|nr:ABC transporter permease [Candidatus Saccharimonadales bacterium]